MRGTEMMAGKECTLTLSDVKCPVCLSLLLKPVTFPCKHNVCEDCFKRYMEITSVECPLCRKRLGSWYRTAKRKTTIINETLWKDIQDTFPQELYDKLHGKDDTILDAPDDRHILPSQPGDLLKELRKFEDSAKQPEILQQTATLEYIRELQEEERIQVQFITSTANTSASTSFTNGHVLDTTLECTERDGSPDFSRPSTSKEVSPAVSRPQVHSPDLISPISEESFPDLRIPTTSYKRSPDLCIPTTSYKRSPDLCIPTTSNKRSPEFSSPTNSKNVYFHVRTDLFVKKPEEQIQNSDSHDVPFADNNSELSTPNCSRRSTEIVPTASVRKELFRATLEKKLQKSNRMSSAINNSCNVTPLTKIQQDSQQSSHVVNRERQELRDLSAASGEIEDDEEEQPSQYQMEYMDAQIQLEEYWKQVQLDGILAKKLQAKFDKESRNEPREEYELRPRKRHRTNEEES